MSYEETLEDTACLCAEGTKEILKELVEGLKGHDLVHDWQERLLLVKAFRDAEVHTVSILTKIPQ